MHLYLYVSVCVVGNTENSTLEMRNVSNTVSDDNRVIDRIVF